MRLQGSAVAGAAPVRDLFGGLKRGQILIPAGKGKTAGPRRGLGGSLHQLGSCVLCLNFSTPGCHSTLPSALSVRCFPVPLVLIVRAVCDAFLRLPPGYRRLLPGPCVAEYFPVEGASLSRPVSCPAPTAHMSLCLALRDRPLRRSLTASRRRSCGRPYSRC
jgi:hypothetical protein